MAIEIVDLPINSMVIFQFAMFIYREITYWAGWFFNKNLSNDPMVDVNG